LIDTLKLIGLISLTMLLTACADGRAKSLDAIPGVYFGIFYGQSSSSLALYEKIGKMPAISAQYLGWSDGFPRGFATANAHLGRITFVTWEYNARTGEEYQNRTLDAITDGKYDAYLTNWALEAAEFGKPILLRWGHEMNGDWYLWGGVHNGGGSTSSYGDPDKADGPERYVDAYRYIHDLFMENGADNVLWVWCPTAPFSNMDTSFGSTGWNKAENYYPGDGYVDWLCFDGYNWGESSFGQQFNSKWEGFDAIFKASYQRLQKISKVKPIIIGEFSSTEDGGDKAAWVADALNKIETDYPQIKAIIWFHIAKETDWRIDSSAESLEAFRSALDGNPNWLSSWPGIIDDKEKNNE
jgi:beta-mannanase